MKKALAGIALLLGPLSADAVGLDLALSNETANVAVLLNPSFISQVGGSEVSLGGFIAEKGDNMLYSTLMARGSYFTNNSSYKLGAGLKAVVGDIERPDGAPRPSDGEDSEAVAAVGLGFQLNFLVAPSQRNPAEISFEGFLAPSIASFRDAEQYSEFSARLQIEVITQAQAYVGYRRISFDTDDFSNLHVDRSFHVGLKFSF